MNPDDDGYYDEAEAEMIGHRLVEAIPDGSDMTSVIVALLDVLALAAVSHMKPGCLVPFSRELGKDLRERMAETVRTRETLRHRQGGIQ